jgi:hypothetical protein
MHTVQSQKHSAYGGITIVLLPSLFFDPKDGGDMFLRKFGRLSVDYMAYILEDRTVHNHCCENLKSYAV